MAIIEIDVNPVVDPYTRLCKCTRGHTDTEKRGHGIEVLGSSQADRAVRFRLIHPAPSRPLDATVLAGEVREVRGGHLDTVEAHGDDETASSRDLHIGAGPTPAVGRADKGLSRT